MFAGQMFSFLLEYFNFDFLYKKSKLKCSEKRGPEGGFVARASQWGVDQDL